MHDEKAERKIIKASKLAEVEKATFSAVIDAGADPNPGPVASRIVAHVRIGRKATIERRGDELYVAGSKVVLLRDGQVGGIPLNACVLDFLVKNGHFVPDSWKAHCVYFPGTEYRRNPSDRRFIRGFHGEAERVRMLSNGFSPEDRIAYLEAA